MAARTPQHSAAQHFSVGRELAVASVGCTAESTKLPAGNKEKKTTPSVIFIKAPTVLRCLSSSSHFLPYFPRGMGNLFVWEGFPRQQPKCSRSPCFLVGINWSEKLFFIPPFSRDCIFNRSGLIWPMDVINTHLSNTGTITVSKQKSPWMASWRWSYKKL